MAKATPTMEDYIEVIYSLVKNKGYARSADIAEKLDVYPSTVTKMLKKLDVEGYIVYEKYRGIALTEQGEKMGEYALTRHELLEDFLRLIGVDEDKVYEEVEGIEHHFGKSSLEKIKDLMKYLRTRVWSLIMLRNIQTLYHNCYQMMENYTVVWIMLEFWKLI